MPGRASCRSRASQPCPRVADVAMPRWHAQAKHFPQGWRTLHGLCLTARRCPRASVSTWWCCILSCYSWFCGAPATPSRERHICRSAGHLFRRCEEKESHLCPSAMNLLGRWVEKENHLCSSAGNLFGRWSHVAPENMLDSFRPMAEFCRATVFRTACNSRCAARLPGDRLRPRFVSGHADRRKGVSA